MESSEKPDAFGLKHADYVNNFHNDFFKKEPTFYGTTNIDKVTEKFLGIIHETDKKNLQMNADDIAEDIAREGRFLIFGMPSTPNLKMTEKEVGQFIDLISKHVLEKLGLSKGKPKQAEDGEAISNVNEVARLVTDRILKMREEGYEPRR